MPQFLITAPDGRKFKISAPEGATKEQALEKIKSSYSTPSAPQAQQPAQAPEDTGIGRTALDQGLQGATFGFADEVTDRIGAGIASVATGEKYDDLLAEARSRGKNRLQQQFEQNPGTAIAANIGGGLLTGGAAASTKAGAALGNSLRTGGTAARIAKGALAGATSGGLYGAGSSDEGHRLEGAGQGALVGGAFGGAIPAIGAAASGVKNAILPKVADAQTAALAQKALDMGIPLKRSQVGDSRFAKVLSSVTQSVPFSGARGFAERQGEAFNKAVLAKAGINATRATPDVLDAAKDEFTKKFGNLINQTTINVDKQTLQRISAIQQEAGKRLGADGQKLIGSYIDDILNTGGKIDGKTYQNTRSQLGQMAKARGGSDPFVAGLLKDMQSTLDDAAFKSLPAAGKKAWQDVRKEYGAFKTIQKAMNSTNAGAAVGNISPGALASAAKSGNPNYAMGAGELNDLARIGGAFVRDNIPNSGTTERLAAYGGLVGLPSAVLSGGGIGSIAVPAAGIGASRLFNTLDTSQRLVRNALKGQGKAIAPLLSIPAGAASGALSGVEGGAAQGATRTMIPKEPVRVQSSSDASPLLDKIAMAESGGNPNAKAKTTSASGLFQFTDATWKGMVRKYGQQYGIKEKDKANPEAQRLMAEKLTAENAAALQKTLGREPTDGELYLAHFAGANGARRLLKRTGAKHIAARILPEAAKANRSIFYDGGRARTVDEVIELISAKVA